MTSSITEYTEKPLGQTSEREGFIDMPDLQADKSERHIPSGVNEVKVAPEDEKEANTASTDPPMVCILCNDRILLIYPVL
jgi:hypothetical protein